MRRSCPALAGMMNADEARRFVAGKVFAFTCFDGSRGTGRVLDDLGAAGSIQFSGAGPVRHVRLPGNTLQIRGGAVCASIKGLPFEPCFNLEKKDERSFRGSVSGMGFAYCDFRHQGASQMLMARSVARPRSLHGSNDPAPRIIACRSVGAGRDAGGRERQARAGQVGAQGQKSRPSPRGPRARLSCAVRPTDQRASFSNKFRVRCRLKVRRSAAAALRRDWSRITRSFVPFFSTYSNACNL